MKLTLTLRATLPLTLLVLLSFVSPGRGAEMVDEVDMPAQANGLGWGGR